MTNLLAACRSVSDLAVVAPRSAWYRLLESELASLALGVQRSLARLLKLSGFVPDAMRAFHRVLNAHPADARVGDVALEAGRFAIQVEERAVAIDFLTRARDSVTSAEIQAEADKLLLRLLPTAEPTEGVVASLEVAPAEPIAWAATEAVPPSLPVLAAAPPPYRAAEPVLDAIPIAARRGRRAAHARAPLRLHGAEQHPLGRAGRRPAHRRLLGRGW